MLEEGRQTSLAKFMEEYAKRSGYSLEEVGIMCGFKTADLIYSFICGNVRLPLDKVAPMAEVLRCDSAQLFALALREWFSPQLVDQMQEAFLVAPNVDPVDLQWLKVLREIFEGDLPEMNDRFKRRLQLVFKSG